MGEHKMCLRAFFDQTESELYCLIASFPHVRIQDPNPDMITKTQYISLKSGNSKREIIHKTTIFH